MPDPKKKVNNEKGAYAENLERLSDLDLLASSVNSLLWSGRKGQGKKNQQKANIATVAVACQVDGSLVFAFNEQELSNVSMSNNLLAVAQLQDIGALYERKVDEPSEPPEKFSKGNNGRLVSVSMEVKGEWKKYLYQPKFANKAVVFNPTEAIKEFVQELYLNGLILKPTKVILLQPTSKAAEHAEMRLVQYCGKVDMIGVSKPCCQLCAQTLESLGIAYTRWSAVSGMRDGWTPPEDIVNTDSSKKLEYR